MLGLSLSRPSALKAGLGALCVTGLCLAASTASAAVMLAGSETNNSNLGTTFSFGAQSVQAGDLVVVAQAGNKTSSQNGGTLSLGLGGSASLGAVTSLNAGATSGAGSNLYYASVTADGSLSATLGSSDGNGNTSSYGLFVLRSTTAGQSLSIVTESFAETSSAAEDFTFNFPAGAIADAGNFGLTTLSTNSAATGDRVVNTVGYDATQTSGGGASTLRGIFTTETASSISPYVVANTNLNTDLSLNLPDFNGIGAVVYAVPEPASLTLLALGSLVIAGGRGRRSAR